MEPGSGGEGSEVREVGLQGAIAHEGVDKAESRSIAAVRQHRE